MIKKHAKLTLLLASWLFLFIAQAAHAQVLPSINNCSACAANPASCLQTGDVVSGLVTTNVTVAPGANVSAPATIIANGGTIEVCAGATLDATSLVAANLGTADSIIVRENAIVVINQAFNVNEGGISLEDGAVVEGCGIIQHDLRIGPQQNPGLFNYIGAPGGDAYVVSRSEVYFDTTGTVEPGVLSANPEINWVSFQDRTSTSGDGIPAILPPGNAQFCDVFVENDPNDGSGLAAVICDGTDVLRDLELAIPGLTQTPGACGESFTAQFQPAPLIEVDKDTSTPNINIFGTAIYTIEVNNTGAAEATNVVISDVLPTGFSLIQTDDITVTDPSVIRTSTVDPVAGASDLTWSAWTIPAGQGLTINFSVQAGDQPGTFDNTASVTADDNISVDDDGNAAQDSDTPAGNDPEDDEDVTIAAAIVGSIEINKTVAGGGIAPAPWTFSLSSSNCPILSSANVSASTANGSGGTATFSNLLVTDDGTAGGNTCTYSVTEIAQNGFSINLASITPADITNLTVTDGGVTSVAITNDTIAQCVAGSNDLGGNVFRDYNADGVDAGDSEPGVGGITVNAYADNNALIATTVVQPNGDYNFTDVFASNDAIRLEFVDLPSFLKEGSGGPDSGTATQFHSVGTCNANFSVSNPGEYCQANPTMAVACYTNGDPAISAVSDFSALYEFDYDSQGTAAGNSTSGQPFDPVEVRLADTGQIATVFGTTFHRSDDTVLLAAMLKRHSGLFSGAGTSNPISTIFQATMGSTDSATIWLDGAAVGINADVSAAINPVAGVAAVPDNATRGLQGLTDVSLDADVFALVGKVGFGDMDISDDDQTVYVVNLADRRLYAIDYDLVTSPTTATFSSIAIPQASCQNGISRPWGLDIHDGRVYVGTVCSGELEADTAVADLDDEASRLSAQVYELTPDADPAVGSVGTFNPNPVLTVELDYNGVANNNEFTREKGCTGNFEACQWAPWLDNYSDAAMYTPFSDLSRPQPILSDIVIEEDGFMVLGFMDRSGHQFGWNNLRPNGQPGTIRVPTGGDILLAAPNGSGGWVIEQNGTAGNRTTAGNGIGPRGRGGPGTQQGPGGGEFFTDEFIRTFHSETAQGALVHLPGSTEIGTIKQDPFTVRSAGISWSSLLVGTDNRSYEILPEQSQTATSANFGKGGSLADMELFCAPAPIEIGNRVWRDENADGVQDPSEAPIAGVTVQLFEWNDNGDGIYQDGELGPVVTQGGNPVTAITDANGNYYFGPRSGDPSLGFVGQDGLTTDTQFIVAIDPVQTVLAATPVVSPITADSQAEAPGAGNTVSASPINVEQDSDGLTDLDEDPVTNNTLVLAPVTTGVAGENDHSHDFGFSPVFDFGDAPDGGATNTDAANYATTLANDGPRHAISPGLSFGADNVDDEADGQPSLDADGDDLNNNDDEDGVVVAPECDCCCGWQWQRDYVVCAARCKCQQYHRRRCLCRRLH